MKRAFVLVLAGLIPASLAAQQPAVLTADDYAHAEKFLGYNTTPLVDGISGRTTWTQDDRIVYRVTSAAGSQFMVVNPARKSRAPAFDAARIAAALSKAADTTYDAMHLPFTSFDYSADGKGISFDVGRRHYACDLAGSSCTASASERRRADATLANAVVSPDSTKAAFIRDYNLWVRDLKSGQETRLTTDGVKDFGYATDNAGWTKSDRAILIWSPDSKKIATYQQDERGVGDMYLVQSRVGHPVLQQWHYPLPGDSIITTIQRVIIDLAGPKVIRLQMPADQHRSTICDDIFCGGKWADVEWSPDASKLIFVSTSRDHKHEWVREADAATGAVREIFDETSPTQFESGFNRVNWHSMPATNELIWFSERDNWGHLYLYDLATGKLKNRITSGSWPVLQVLRVDEKGRTIWFTGAGREGGDPYFRHFYSVKMDGSKLTLLTPEDADHDVTLSPDGKYFVDSYSTPTTPPVTVVRDARTGKLLVTAEKGDISRLLAAGWKPPVPVTVKARDGKTDIYGLMYLPTHLDSTAKYPIVNNIYPGPQTGSVGSRSFSAARGDCQALAELGFVVVQLDAMGTPMRSKSFHDAYYGNMGDNGLPDQIAGMKELASRYRFIDIDRAGIWGHSGGGFATADAMFRYPDFFKVGISESGNHDNREYEDDWGERYQGLETRGPNGSSYDDQANQNIAKNLKGKLLLAHGTTDNNVPPYNTFLVVDALIKANKDFDLLLLPNQLHGYGAESSYMMRRRWDYFVRNLRGAEPPKEYELRPPQFGGRPGL